MLTVLSVVERAKCVGVCCVVASCIHWRSLVRTRNHPIVFLSGRAGGGQGLCGVAVTPYHVHGPLTTACGLWEKRGGWLGVGPGRVLLAWGSREEPGSGQPS